MAFLVCTSHAVFAAWEGYMLLLLIACDDQVL